MCVNVLQLENSEFCTFCLWYILSVVLIMYCKFCDLQGVSPTFIVHDEIAPLPIQLKRSVGLVTVLHICVLCGLLADLSWQVVISYLI